MHGTTSDILQDIVPLVRVFNHDDCRRILDDRRYLSDGRLDPNGIRSSQDRRRTMTALENFSSEFEMSAQFTRSKSSPIHTHELLLSERL